MPLHSYQRMPCVSGRSLGSDDGGLCGGVPRVCPSRERGAGHSHVRIACAFDFSYMYEYAETKGAYRHTLPQIRAGEYEKVAERIVTKEWEPDFGPAKFIPRWGATVCGARKLLIAFNINVLVGPEAVCEVGHEAAGAPAGAERAHGGPRTERAGAAAGAEGDRVVRGGVRNGADQLQSDGLPRDEHAPGVRGVREGRARAEHLAVRRRDRGPDQPGVHSASGGLLHPQGEPVHPRGEAEDHAGRAAPGPELGEALRPAQDHHRVHGRGPARRAAGVALRAPVRRGAGLAHGGAGRRVGVVAGELDGHRA